MKRPGRLAVTLLLGAVALLSSMTGESAVMSAHAPPPGIDLHGVWWEQHPPETLVPEGGGSIPYTAEGRKLYAASVKKLSEESGRPVGRDDMRRCLPFGPTRILQQPFPIQIFQKGRLFVIAYEHNHVYEIVYLDENPDPGRDPAYMGNSVGHWIRDGLRIDTTVFKEGTLLDNSGIPHSDKLSMVRTLRKIAGGKQLEIETTIIDPVMFSRPWTVKNVLDARPDARLEEYTCGQGPILEDRYSGGAPN